MCWHCQCVGVASVLVLPVGMLSLAAGIWSVIVALQSRSQVDNLAVLGPTVRGLLRMVTKGEAATLPQLLHEDYAEPHLIETKNNARAASNVSR
jgi:hypothetical protein